MVDENETIKKEIAGILEVTPDMNLAISKLGALLSTLRPMGDADKIHMVCDASIFCASKIGKTEIIAQLYLMKARAEISKPAILIHEMKNLTLALGWFSHALNSEKKRYEELDGKVNEIWNNTQTHLDTGFEYLSKKAYTGPAGYCYQIAGEIYGSFYLQFKLYKMYSRRPWRSRIAMFKLLRFLNIDDVLLLDSGFRNKAREIKKDSLRYITESIRCFKDEEAWSNLADSYLALANEHRSFNNPIRSRYAIYKAEKIISKYSLIGLKERLGQFKSKAFFSKY